jgi:hypothetical protein
MDMIASTSTRAATMTFEGRLADVKKKWPRVQRRPGRTAKQMVIEIAAEMFERRPSNDPRLGPRSFRNFARSVVCPTEGDYRAVAELQERVAVFSAQKSS